MTAAVFTFTIDGKDVAGSEGQTVMEVAEESGIDIPGLCHLDGIHDRGACRLCMVEIGGSPRLTAACTTQIAEGMDVTAHSERLLEYRRAVTEMLFLERNHVCAVCVANNHCELQEMADELGVTHFDLPRINPTLEIDASHRLFAIDHNRCILCLRCVRVCDEIEGAHTWDVMHRGLETRVQTDMGIPWGESTTCTSCGKCVQVCPTGALFEKGRAVSSGSKHERPFLPWLRVVQEERGL
jgi:bidirectional [NiFe] hydrogenase diaphorase subunit